MCDGGGGGHDDRVSSHQSGATPASLGGATPLKRASPPHAEMALLPSLPPKVPA